MVVDLFSFPGVVCLLNELEGFCVSMVERVRWDDTIIDKRSIDS